MIMKPTPTERKKRRRRRVAAVLVGVLLAVVCHFLPLEYQEPCSAIAGIVNITCGGPS